MTENTDKKQQKHKFIKGQSGNPNGRPKGALNKSTLAIKNLFEGESEQIGRKAIEMAKNGEMQAIKLIIDRIYAPKKENSLNLDISKVSNSTSLINAGNDILLAISNGNITISEGKELFSILESMRKNIEIEDLEKRLEILENNQIK